MGCRIIISKQEILLENAATFRAAVTCATNEQNVQDRIHFETGQAS